MKFVKLSFNDNGSQGLYDNYIDRVQHVIKTLSESDQLDILLEINSHIFESLKFTHSRNEYSALIDVLENIGPPETVLQPLVADKKLEQATRSFNPIHVFKALILNVSNGIFYFIISVFYALLTMISIIILGKVLFPDYVGVYIKPGEMFMIGSPIHESASLRQYEVLGDWFIPVMSILVIVLYFGLTLVLRIHEMIKEDRKSDWLQTQLNISA